MLEFQGNNKIFQQFSYALDVVNVTFQHILMFKEHFRTNMVKYSGKYAAYVMKLEVDVQPTELAIFLSSPFVWSAHDIHIFQANVNHHSSCTIEQKMALKMRSA